jgi:hypothetical protein
MPRVLVVPEAAVRTYVEDRQRPLRPGPRRAPRRPWSPLTPTAALDTVRGDDTIDVR